MGLDAAATEHVYKIELNGAIFGEFGSAFEKVHNEKKEFSKSA